MIHIGIDIGHGETSVSRTPGYNDEITSRIALNRGSHVRDMKVVSAICRNSKEDPWRFVLNDLDYQSAEIREGFKGKVDKDDTDREALGEFVKLIFNTILANDKELSYNPETGEANFDICIACPSDWRNSGSSMPEKYLRFFRDTYGIKPIKMCINESDAAFYTKFHKYKQDDSVLVIDLGSSTIDFTTYSGNYCRKDLCWGANLGAHIIEDKLIEKGYEFDYNIERMKRVEQERDNTGQGPVSQGLSLLVRKAKEDYFTTKQYKNKLPFVAEVSVRQLVKGWQGKLTEKAFILELEFDEFNEVISEYKQQLKTMLEFAAKKLGGQDVKPNYILLSGGASRMDFVHNFAKEAFPNATIDVDSTPEWVVSDGASKYINTWCEVQNEIEKLKQEFRKWANDNLVPIVKTETLKAFEEALRLELRWRFDQYYLNNTNNGTNLKAFQKIAIEAIENSTKTPEFIDNANNRFISSINGQIVSKMQEIILKLFKKKVTIDAVFVDPGDFFKDFTASTEAIKENIQGMASELFNTWFETMFNDDYINWDKERTDYERKLIVDKACEVLPSGYYVTFDESIVNKWIEEACDSIQTILIANGLFEITI